MTDPIDYGAYVLTEEKIQALVTFFTKDYGQEAFSFVKNHHRLLHYLGEGIDLLPPQETEGKRRKFSFFDLVWLGIVLELRAYGMEKEKIAVLKEELMVTPDYAKLLKTISERRAEFEETMRASLNLTEEGTRQIIDTLLAKKQELLRQDTTLLATYLYYTVTKETPVSLLVSKDGHHQLRPMDVAESDLPPLDGGPFATSYLTLSLDGILRFYAALPLVTPSIKKVFLTEREQALIEETRKEGLKSVTVRFRNGKMEQLESTKQKKVSVEARLTEMLIKGGYEDIKITTEKGRIVSVEQTEKKRFEAKA